MAGIVFEAVRLVMVQRILSAPEFKMDPLVSLYYYAPACAAINGVITLFVEVPKMGMGDIYNVGIFTLLLNAAVAFGLNVSVVFLVSFVLYAQIMSSVCVLIATDWQNFRRCAHSLGCAQGYSPGRRIHGHFPGPCGTSAILRVFHRSRRTGLVQARRRRS